MSMHGPGKKQSHMAFAVHAARILAGTTKKQFVTRPGKTYLEFLPPYFTNKEEFEFSLNLICEHYSLNPSESFRKATLEAHYEIMDKLLQQFEDRFPNEYPYLMDTLEAATRSGHRLG